MRLILLSSMLGLTLSFTPAILAAEPNHPQTQPAPCATQPDQELKRLETQIKEVEARIGETDEPFRRVVDRVRQLKKLQNNSSTQPFSTSKPMNIPRLELDKELQDAIAEEKTLLRHRYELQNKKRDLLTKHYTLADNLENTSRNIVYLVDCSGTMLEIFDYIKADLIHRINKLSPEQNFHVIFFSTGTPIENPPKGLIPATDENKRKFVDLLRDIVPEGETNPAKALERAFQVTDEKGDKAQIMYLYTDGIIPSNIPYFIRKLNSDKKVKINIISFISEDNRQILDTIAKENGGKHRFVAQDELGK